eukprot:TRINITY_DN66759_c0_g1_i1.p2 TRINITY_DN66759_c0_g1~~TRINITY_DN66759_c0_g1_i1.p2  ORF type:complete len:103 (-),score=8.93 TRINITY_DN66759_c0_g1_i1:94-402(-)
MHYNTHFLQWGPGTPMRIHHKLWECFLSLTNKVEKASAAPLLCGGTGALKPILFHLSFDVINRCPLQQARCQCIIRVLHVGNNSTFAVGSGADRSPYNRYNA